MLALLSNNTLHSSQSLPYSSLLCGGSDAGASQTGEAGARISLLLRNACFASAKWQLEQCLQPLDFVLKEASRGGHPDGTCAAAAAAAAAAP